MSSMRGYNVGYYLSSQKEKLMGKKNSSNQIVMKGIKDPEPSNAVKLELNPFDRTKCYLQLGYCYPYCVRLLVGSMLVKCRQVDFP